MARINKIGLDYFSFDVNFFNDDKIQLIEAEFGIKGSYLAIRLLAKIYSEGYYYKWGTDECLLFTKNISADGVSNNFVDEVVKGLIRRGIFEKTVFDSFGILTSKGIQRRFLEATIRRQSISILKEIWLINHPKGINVYINSINDNINKENVYINSQSKVKKSKVKKSKVKKRNNTDVLLKDEKNENFPILFSAKEPEIITEIQEQSNYIYGAEFERLKNQMLQEEMWIEAVCQKTGRGAFLKTILPEKIDEFFAQAITNSKMDITENLAEAKRYFSNWINSNNNASKPIPSEQPSLTMEQLRRESITYKGE